MSDLQERARSTSDSDAGKSLFSAGKPDAPRRGFFFGTGIAVPLVALIAAAVLLRGRHEGGAAALNAQLPADPYAKNLIFTQLAMSQSTSLSGGTSTFLDGRVRNAGPSILSGITVQAIFKNDVGLSPQVNTMPLFLVRTHEPYIDTEPVSASPLKPGDEVEFRLIFETLPSNWNQQMPEIQVVRVAKR